MYDQKANELSPRCDESFKASAAGQLVDPMLTRKAAGGAAIVSVPQTDTGG